MFIKKSFLFIFVLSLLFFFSHAQAMGLFKAHKFLMQKNMIKIYSDVNVNQNETVPGNVIAVLGNVNVNGKINGSLVSVFGKVTIGPKAEIGENLIVLLNNSEVQTGAIIGNNNVEINVPGRNLLVKVAKFWFHSLLTNIIIGIIVLALLIWIYIQFIIPKLSINGMVRIFTANAPLMFLYGILGLIVLRIISLVLLVTIVGSAAAILFGVAVNLLYLIGFISVITYAGSIINTILKTKLSSAAQFIIGFFGLIILAFVPILGMFVILILSLISFGAVLTQVFKLKIAK